MIIPVAAVLAVLAPMLLGGSPARMAGLRLRYAGWVAAALAVQVLILELLSGPESVLQAAHVATYVVAVGFLLANARVPGLWLVGLGTLSNGVTITINGGTLPARAGALEAAGIDVTQPGFVNSGVVSNAHLPWLGDVFAIPAPLPLANVFSVGDVLIIAGIAVVSWRVCGTRWTRPWSLPRHRREGSAYRNQPRRSPAHVIPRQRDGSREESPAAVGSRTASRLSRSEPTRTSV
jgi:hypothetical protein